MKTKRTWAERYCASGDPKELRPLKNGQVMLSWWRKNGERFVSVRCFCGSVRNVEWYPALKSQSCGCITNDILRAARSIHGHSKQNNGNGSPTFISWKSMLDRCYMKPHKSWKYYGGRGITVCPRWRADFAHFLADMGERPVGLQLGRIDNDGIYEPSNCEWQTAKKNANNRSNNVFLNFNGERATVAQWADKTGISFWAIDHRLRAGWPVEKALTQPMRQQRRAVC